MLRSVPTMHRLCEMQCDRSKDAGATCSLDVVARSLEAGQRGVNRTISCLISR